jgi:hypothetical protein
MKRVQALFAEHRSRIATHAFFDWLSSAAAPARERFCFTPLMVDFTMGFADMNKWFLGYENPRNDLEASINQHTLEDRTHSKLFLENWHALGLDDQLGWSASQTLWWLYHSPATLPVRRFGWDILRLSVEYPDPLVRFSLMEAIEICGDVFFGNTKRVAQEMSRQTGIDYRYYGEYHHLRETGHLHTDESPFFAAQLSSEQLQQATRAVTDIFRGFSNVLDHLLAHSRNHDSGSWAAFAAQGDSAMQARTGLTRVRNALPRSVASSSQAPLLDFLRERQAQLTGHPLLDWLAHAPLPGSEKLQRFAPLWAIDIAGYPDFNDFALTYRTPSGAAQHALDGWAAALSRHGILYLQDWQSLNLDRTLGWSAGETIGFYFLHDYTELHRRNLAKVTRLAFSEANPLWRYWLMTAFEAGGDPLFDALMPVVEDAQKDAGPLSYWAQRHGASTTSSLLSERQQMAFAELTAMPIGAEEQRRISEMISTLFDNFEQQFSLSHRVANELTFLDAPGSLPPAVARAPRLDFAHPAERASAR